MYIETGPLNSFGGAPKGPKTSSKDVPTKASGGRNCPLPCDEVGFQTAALLSLDDVRFGQDDDAMRW